MASNSSNAKDDDFIEFKKYATETFAILKNEIENLKEKQPTNQAVESQNTVIDVLKAEIEFLRNENKELTNIIKQKIPQQQQNFENNSFWEKSKSKHTSPNTNTRFTPFNLPLKNRFNPLEVSPRTHPRSPTPHSAPPSPKIPTIPGHKTYAETVKKTRENVIVFSDSMTKRIRPSEFNKHTPQHKTFFKSFSGVNTKALHSYTDYTLSSYNHDIAVIHVGTNDLSPRRGNEYLNENQIAQQIINIAKNCQSKGVKKVVISSIIKRSDKNMEHRRVLTNKEVERMCKDSGFIFLNNDNIGTDKLYQDGIHLSDEGLKLFADNLIGILHFCSN